MRAERLLALLGLLWLAAGAAGAAWAAGPAGSVAPPATLHAAHPEHAIEWWYFTGFVDIEGGGRHALQVTFFRLRPPPGAWSENPSSFTPRQVYLAQAALGDLAHGTRRTAERVARGGAGGGSAAAHALALRVAEWELTAAPGHWRLRVPLGEEWLELELRPQGAPVHHGDAGRSRKAFDGRYFSHYYSYPQVLARGTLGSGAEQRAVRGELWFDHEWSDGLLPPGASGWDWLWLRFDDGAALMAFRVRDAAPGRDFHAGTWITRDGVVRALGPGALKLRSLETWRSPRTGVRWPVVLELSVGARRWRIEALHPAQEMGTDSALSPVYWEGAVRARGASHGHGFVELTGYDGQPVFGAQAPEQ